MGAHVQRYVFWRYGALILKSVVRLTAGFRTMCVVDRFTLFTFNITVCMLGKILADVVLKYFFLYFPDNRIWNSMQIVSTGYNVHEIPNSVFWEKKKKKKKKMSSIWGQWVVKVKRLACWDTRPSKRYLIFSFRTKVDICKLSQRRYCAWIVKPCENKKNSPVLNVLTKWQTLSTLIRDWVLF